MLPLPLDEVGTGDDRPAFAVPVLDERLVASADRPDIRRRERCHVGELGSQELRSLDRPPAISVPVLDEGIGRIPDHGPDRPQIPGPGPGQVAEIPVQPCGRILSGRPAPRAFPLGRCGTVHAAQGVNPPRLPLRQPARDREEWPRPFAAAASEHGEAAGRKE